MAAPSRRRVLRRHWYRSGPAAKVTGRRRIICPVYLPGCSRSVLRASRICSGGRGSGPPQPHQGAHMSRHQLAGQAGYHDPGDPGMNQVRRWRAFAVLAVSFFMTVADLAIVNVALPTIGRKLHMAESSLQWVVTGYALTFGGFLLLGGRAADLL